jgi:HSP20 family protein
VATLVRWEPIRELATLQTEMSRLMNGLFEGNGRTTQSWVPAVDVWETENELVYAFDLPGVPEDRIAIELHDDTLTVSAERERADERTEDGFVRYERDYRDGVLEIRVAKPETPKPKKIAVGSSHPTIES